MRSGAFTRKGVRRLLPWYPPAFDGRCRQDAAVNRRDYLAGADGFGWYSGTPNCQSMNDQTSAVRA